MIEVLLFHHALGLTAGVRAFADELREVGCAVVTPDLYDGKTFDSLEDGVLYAEGIGMEVLAERGASHASELGDQIVVVGLSLGVLPAQKLAQTRSEVVGAVLCHSVVPLSTFGDRWPEHVVLQMHLGKDDPWAAEDLEAAEALAEASGGELFLYPGSGHLVTDGTSADYDSEVTGQILARTRRLLETVINSR